MIYRLYFELFGKKMQATVEAKDRHEAEQIIRDKVIFHKIVSEGDPGNFDSIKDVFGKFGINL